MSPFIVQYAELGKSRRIYGPGHIQGHQSGYFGRSLRGDTRPYSDTQTTHLSGLARGTQHEGERMVEIVRVAMYRRTVAVVWEQQPCQACLTTPSFRRTPGPAPPRS